MRGGIISAGGVGFDISCGIRCLRTDLTLDQLAPRLGLLADRLYRDIPAGVGEEGQLKLTPRELDDVLEGGAQWAVRRGYGSAADLEFVEERGRIEGAVPGNVSELAKAASRLGIELPDRELACAPIRSPEGEQYIGAMNAAINCALANRQLLAHLTRQTIARDFPHARLETLFDVSHNTCKIERHELEGKPRLLYVHRKGATRAFGPGHPALPPRYRDHGQPVIIGGSMGTGSYILCGTHESEARAFGSASHGAGRAMSRHQALKQWRGRKLIGELAQRGILIRTRSMRGAAEEAPGAYKDVDLVAEATERAGLAKRVAFLRPKICIKG